MSTRLRTPFLADAILSHLGDLTPMTSAKLSDFWTPFSPHPIHIWQLIYIIKLTQPLLLWLHFGINATFWCLQYYGKNARLQTFSQVRNLDKHFLKPLGTT